MKKKDENILIYQKYQNNYLNIIIHQICKFFDYMINIILKTKSNVDFIINIVSEFNKIYMNLNNFYLISSLIFFYKKF